MRWSGSSDGSLSALERSASLLKPYLELKGNSETWEEEKKRFQEWTRTVLAHFFNQDDHSQYIHRMLVSVKQRHSSVSASNWCAVRRGLLGPTWVWGRRCWARHGTFWWFPRLWTSCASSPAALWETHYWDVSTAARWTCSGSCHGADRRRVRTHNRMQLNVYAQCIYLSGGGIMTFECPPPPHPKEKRRHVNAHYNRSFNWRWQNSLFKLQTKAEALFVWWLKNLHRRLYVNKTIDY